MKQSMRRVLTLRLSIALQGLFCAGLLAGCGGGATSSTKSAEVGKQTLGSLVTRVVGTAQPPVTTSGNGSAVTAIVGAAITSLTNNRYGALNLSDTKIAYSRRVNGVQQLFTVNSDGSTPVQITSASANSDHPCLSSDGGKIVFNRLVGVTSQIFTANADGTNPVQRTTDAIGKSEAVWSPDGKRIAYTGQDAQGSKIYLMNADGSGVSALNTGFQYNFDPGWSPDGTQLVAAGHNGGIAVIFAIGQDSGGRRILTDNSTDNYQPSWSPDGQQIALSRVVNGRGQIFTMFSDGGNLQQKVFSNAGDLFPTWAPDSHTLAFLRLTPNISRQILVRDTTDYTSYGLAANAIVTTDWSEQDLVPLWSRYLPRTPQTLIGTGGLLGTAAAGFVFGRQGDNVTSVVAFDAAAGSLTSRAGVRAAAQTSADSNSPNLIFNITAADSLSSLKFVNFTGLAIPTAATAVSMPAGTTGVLIDFNNSTGKVSGVLPYAANRAAGGFPRRKEGDALIFTGHFSGCWTADGKNIAPNGASEVRISASTGDILQVR